MRKLVIMFTARSHRQRIRQKGRSTARVKVYDFGDTIEYLVKPKADRGRS
jgi:hypothetical protein